MAIFPELFYGGGFLPKTPKVTPRPLVTSVTSVTVTSVTSRNNMSILSLSIMSLPKCHVNYVTSAIALGLRLALIGTLPVITLAQSIKAKSLSYGSIWLGE